MTSRKYVDIDTKKIVFLITQKITGREFDSFYISKKGRAVSLSCVRLEVVHEMFSYRMCEIWNGFPHQVVGGSSVNVFKRE